MERLISKMFAGKCSREELLELLRMMKLQETEPAPEVMERLWEELRDFGTLPPAKSQEIYSETLRKIERNSTGKRTLHKYWIATAASVTLLIGLYLWSSIGTAGDTITIETSFAEQTRVELPDGSEVTLNANSRIAYARYWNNREVRQVRLRGEAFFEVARNESTGQKFEVITEDLTVEVLGTSFNVNTHHQQTRVFLEEGSIKLKLEARPETLMLEPGDLFSYSQKTQKALKKKTEKQPPSSWKDGIVVFKDVPLRKILQRIDEIYGLDYQVTDPDQLDRIFTISVPVDNFETMRAILQETIGEESKIGIKQLKIK